MKTLLMIITLLWVNNANAKFYFELGIGFNQSDSGLYSEDNFPSPLGRYAFGYHAQDNWFLEYEHTSSVLLDENEEGAGQNIIWFTKRIYF